MVAILNRHVGNLDSEHSLTHTGIYLKDLTVVF